MWNARDNIPGTPWSSFTSSHWRRITRWASVVGMTQLMHLITPYRAEGCAKITCRACLISVSQLSVSRFVRQPKSIVSLLNLSHMEVFLSGSFWFSSFSQCCSLSPICAGTRVYRTMQWNCSRYFWPKGSPWSSSPCKVNIPNTVCTCNKCVTKLPWAPWPPRPLYQCCCLWWNYATCSLETD